MKATQQLIREHEDIKLMLNILETISGKLEKDNELNIAHFEKILDFIKKFADKCHHGKEENILFPAMVAHGIPNEIGPIAVMLDEHKLGRLYLNSLINAFEEYLTNKQASYNNIISSSRSYVEHLRNHIEKENDILFKMADIVFNETEQSKIYDDFEKLEMQKLGDGKSKEYQRLLKELKAIYL